MSPAVAPVIAPASVRRLLLVKLSSLGDIIHSLPLLESLRLGLGPEVTIAWAVRSKFAEILDGNPNLSLSYTLTGKGLSDIWTFGRRLRGEKFDVALDAQGLLLSGMVTFLASGGPRIGWDINREGNRHFLTHPVVPGTDRAHIVEKLLRFCPALGIAATPVCRQEYLAEGEKERAVALLPNTGKPIVGCIVGASTPVKTYPAEQWAEVVRQLLKAGMQPALLGGPGEKATAEAIAQKVGSTELVDLTGKTPLRVLASTLARCQVVIGGDSGPTHLAVAVGTPVVGLYGVTDPARTGPDWGPARAIVLDYAEKDAPPALRRPRHPTLTDALARIPPDAVVRAAASLL